MTPIHPDNLDEQPWFVFKLPGSTVYVPLASEDAARAHLAEQSYKGAPVHEWPCVGSRFTSREMLTRERMRKAAA